MIKLEPIKPAAPVTNTVFPFNSMFCIFFLSSHSHMTCTLYKVNMCNIHTSTYQAQIAPALMWQHCSTITLCSTIAPAEMMQQYFHIFYSISKLRNFIYLYYIYIPYSLVAATSFIASPINSAILLIGISFPVGFAPTGWKVGTISSTLSTMSSQLL